MKNNGFISARDLSRRVNRDFERDDPVEVFLCGAPEVKLVTFKPQEDIEVPTFNIPNNKDLEVEDDYPLQGVLPYPEGYSFLGVTGVRGNLYGYVLDEAALDTLSDRYNFGCLMLFTVEKPAF